MLFMGYSIVILMTKCNIFNYKIHIHMEKQGNIHV